MAEINSEKIKIADIFSDRFQFKIPDFQRPLSWKKDNFEKLFEDIYSAFNEGQEEYFLGSIILQQEKDSNVYFIIDGQQRLTAVALLLAVIRDNTKDEELKKSIQKALFQEEDKFKNLPSVARIKLWEDLNIVENYIYELNGTSEYINKINNGEIKYTDKEDAKYHLYEALTCYDTKYKEIFQQNSDLVGRFVRYIYNNVYVICISTKDLPYAIQLFNILNTRGLPLTTADILKAENLSVIDENKRSDFAKKWRDIENDIGRENVEKVIEFIRTLKLKTKAKSSIYKEYSDLIFRENKLKKGEDFINYFLKISNIYNDYILDPENLKVENKYKNLVKLMRKFITFDDWIPPLISFCEKFQNYNSNNETFINFLPAFLYSLEKKTVIEWVAGFSFTKRILELNKIIEVVEQENTPKEVIDKLKKELIDKNLKKQFREKVDGKEFYFEEFAKYLLLRLDLEKVDQENFTGYKGTITIEHILPQNPPAESEWCQIFEEDQRKEWTNKIGNLVLLGRRKNAKARNYDFEKKKEKYFLEGGTTPFKITEEIKEVQKWDLKNLQERQNKLVEELLNLYFGD